MDTLATTRSLRGRFWWLNAIVADVVCLILGIVTALSLCRVLEVVRRNPFGWMDTADLAVAVLVAFAAWGFFRFLVQLFTSGLANRHPGAVAWWLCGGIWVMAAAVDRVVEIPSHDSDAVEIMLKLGAALAVPLVPPLVVACLRRAERAVAGWGDWFGFAVAVSFPGQYLLFIILRD